MPSYVGDFWDTLYMEWFHLLICCEPHIEETVGFPYSEIPRQGLDSFNRRSYLVRLQTAVRFSAISNIVHADGIISVIRPAVRTCSVQCSTTHFRYLEYKGYATLRNLHWLFNNFICNKKLILKHDNIIGLYIVRFDWSFVCSFPIKFRKWTHNMDVVTVRPSSCIIFENKLMEQSVVFIVIFLWLFTVNIFRVKLEGHYHFSKTRCKVQYLVNYEWILILIFFILTFVPCIFFVGRLAQSV
jgi:hypothetical protein